MIRWDIPGRSELFTLSLLAAVWAGACTGNFGDEGPALPGSTGQGAGGAGTAAAESPSPRLLRQLTLAEYTATLSDLLHLSQPDTSQVPPDQAVDGYTTNVASNFVTQDYMDAYSSVASAVATRVLNESYAQVVPCQTQDMACETQFVSTFGQRAFRRPLTNDEVTRYLGLFDNSLTMGDFKTGVSLVIQAMLISPNFLFRSELGVDNGQGVFVLTPYEVASALSYAYWGTMPDDALFAAAASGALSSRAQIQGQAQRLLADPRGRSRVASFFYEWMQGSRANIANPDKGIYPAIYAAPGGFAAVVEAMREEEDDFVTNVAFDSTKKFSELFTANYTFANDTLAAYYGLAAPGTGATTTKVQIGPSSARGGVLTLGMFLLGHARADESSPTQRGHQIRANILCSDVPPPPMGVVPIIPPGAPGHTGRDQIQALTGSGICNSCHSLMNPIGFGLEAFDGAGQQRTLDNGYPIDTTGQLTGFNDASGNTIKFDGARQLSNILSSYATAQACFAANYYRYLRGFNPQGVDQPAVQKLQQNFVQTNEDLPNLFVDVVLQDSFVQRRNAEVIKP
jgi:Protein of unknown function (DUF1592)/Protein of unknown function (DUF1588)/Protein of unknown function (DUF1595)/Protein of unknown function (DUF1587)/Protein of unknown function (DUF1585)